MSRQEKAQDSTLSSAFPTSPLPTLCILHLHVRMDLHISFSLSAANAYPILLIRLIPIVNATI